MSLLSPITPARLAAPRFDGWRIVAGAFVLAVFGWGLGFYGPPIYLEAVTEGRGWPVGLVSAAVTTHYLAGAILVANLPRLHARFGLPAVTRAGVVALALGLAGWAAAAAPWQLFLATLLSGCGWVTMGAAAINAIVSPWFVADRPKALSTAYNGASIGGVLFSPLWVLLIGAVGFLHATLVVGLTAVAVVLVLTQTLFGRTPESRGQLPDGRPQAAAARPRAAAVVAPRPGRMLWADWRFRTLAAGMALGLFAQIGLLAHLFSLIVPALGAAPAGLVMGLATAAAIAGRTAFAWLMPKAGDRRRTAMLSYAIQIAGVAVLVASGIRNPVLIVLGILLLGCGIGNATSLPPLIAQLEFAPEDTGRVVALIVAIAQAAYAFAPATFGLARELAGGAGALVVLALAFAAQLLAIAAFAAGRGRRPGAYGLHQRASIAAPSSSGPIAPGVREKRGAGAAWRSPPRST
jgi:MFS family permease